MNRLKFKGRKQSVRAIIALIMACAAISALFIMVILNGIYYVDINIIFGIAGILAFGISIAGFVLAITSMKERDIFYGIPITAISMNGISIVVYFVLYIMGLI